MKALRPVIYASILAFPFSTLHAATITVNTITMDPVSGVDGYCMLVEAIEAANTNVSTGVVAGECIAGDAQPVVDVIEFDTTILPAYISPFSELLLTESVHIKGPGMELLDLGGFSFNRVFKILNTAAAAQFTLSDMRFSYSAIRLPFAEYGGAILASHVGGASLTLERLHFLANNAEKGGGALALTGGNSNTTVIRDSLFEYNYVSGVDANTAGGGAIFIGAHQEVTIEGSTFSGNYVYNTQLAQPLDDMAGGAILMLSSTPSGVSELTIDRSTFSANKAVGVGGGLSIGGPGFAGDYSDVAIRHSTFTLNESDSNLDQTGPDQGGGGIYSSASMPVTIFNTISAENTDQSQSAAPDLAGTYNSNGFNMIGNNEGASIPFPVGQPNANNDTVGTDAQPLDPRLSPLADNGGPTPTHQLQITSPALDRGKCNVQTIDQRHSQNAATNLRTIDVIGVPNLLSGCDIGAVEFGGVSADPPPVANNDNYSVREGEELMVFVFLGLLENDVDDDDLVVSSAGSFAADSTDAPGLVELLADGSFTFNTDDPDAFGTATFEYTITDMLNSSTADVTITVNAVNDAPGFNTAQPQIAAPLGQMLTYPAWATDITRGPPNEAGQVLNFTVTPISVPAGFFASPPTVNVNNGNLRFALSATASGVAEASVNLHDDGGTIYGGQDTYSTTLIIQASDVIFANNFD
ncbi:choice-of-anchor Q domain-containing protein [Dokdonella sp.]|uniref:choice-of-anchor Q domain-containing protein n=1 Tax=Dokdonella sp. TaxID=2291710 RepID=UPI003C59CDF9